MIQTNKKFVITIVGPTAVGKTAFSVFIAKHLNCEIISSDSRQFYKEMFIGTARPSQEEMDGIKHHFVGQFSIEQNFSAGEFEKQAIAIIENIHLKQDTVIVVGGSGLYHRAITHGLDNPPASESIRNQLIDEYNSKGIETLQAELKELDPISYQKIDIQNQQRLIRALEVCRVSGKPYSYFLNHQQKSRPFKTISIGLELPRELLYHQINLRVDEMIKSGLIEEAKELYPKRALNALNTVGYKELFAAFDGNFSIVEAIEKIKQNTRNFAKRQLTWFNKYSDAQWFSPNQKKEAFDYIQKQMRN